MRDSAAMQRRFAAATRLVEIWLFFVRALCIAAASGPAALPKTLAAVADIRKPDSPALPRAVEALEITGLFA